MAHQSLETLQALLEEAKTKVTLGGEYSHYKNPLSRYLVLGLVVIEASDEIAVRYSSHQHPEVEFIRPLTSWLDKIDGKKRFEEIV